MNIDDFGIFFKISKFIIFQKKNSKFHFSKFQNVDFFFKIKISKIPNLPQITLRPSQTLLYSLKQPIGIDPNIFRLRRWLYQGVPPLFLDVSQRSGSFTEHPLLGGCFLRGSEKIQMREFFDFQIFNFQIFRFGILPKYSKETPNHQIRSRSVFPLLYRRVQIHLCIEFKKFLFFLHF